MACLMAWSRGRGEVVGHGAAGGVDDEREDARPPARVELDGRSRGGEHDHDDGQPGNQTNRTSTAIGARYHAQAPPVSGSSSPQLAHGAHRGRGEPGLSASRASCRDANGSKTR